MQVGWKLDPARRNGEMLRSKSLFVGWPLKSTVHGGCRMMQINPKNTLCWHGSPTVQLPLVEFSYTPGLSRPEMFWFGLLKEDFEGVYGEPTVHFQESLVEVSKC